VTTCGIRHFSRCTIIAAAATLSGCGFAAPTQFTNSVIGTDGQPILLDDIRKIVNDSTLSDDEKRQALRDLGLEDEKLIDVLLGL